MSKNKKDNKDKKDKEVMANEIRKSVMDLRHTVQETRMKTDDILEAFDSMSRDLKDQVEDLKETTDNLPL